MLRPMQINPKDSMTRPAQLAALRWQKEADLVDALAALEVHHGGAGQVKTTGRFEQQLLHYRHEAPSPHACSRVTAWSAQQCA